MLSFLKSLFGIFTKGHRLAITYDSGGHKPAIVLLHGIAATSKTWEPLIRQLDEKRYRIIAIDLLGFGNSIKPTSCNYSIDDHVKSVRRTIKKLHLKNYRLVGHSMGALIAAHYSYLFPIHVKQLLLLSPPIYLNDKNLNLIARNKTDFYMKAYDFILKNKDFTIKNSQLLRKIFKIEDGIDVNQDNWMSFKKSLKNTIINQDLFHEIENVKLPTKIMYGALDEFLVPEVIKKLSSCSHIEITKLNGINHLLGKRYAKEVAREICA